MITVTGGGLGIMYDQKVVISRTGDGWVAEDRDNTSRLGKVTPVHRWAASRDCPGFAARLSEVEGLTIPAVSVPAFDAPWFAFYRRSGGVETQIGGMGSSGPWVDWWGRLYETLKPCWREGSAAP